MSQACLDAFIPANVLGPVMPFDTPSSHISRLTLCHRRCAKPVPEPPEQHRFPDLQHKRIVREYLISPRATGKAAHDETITKVYLKLYRTPVPIRFSTRLVYNEGRYRVFAPV